MLPPSVNGMRVVLQEYRVHFLHVSWHAAFVMSSDVVRSTPVMSASQSVMYVDNGIPFDITVAGMGGFATCRTAARMTSSSAGVSGNTKPREQHSGALRKLYNDQCSI